MPSPELESRSETELMHALRATPELWDALRTVRGTELQIQAQLRHQFSDDLVRGALQLLDLRHRAAEKFRRADHMWFDRVGLEQSTSERVAQHKAQRFSGDVWDLCCGIGGDALALATRGLVMAVDRNPAALLRTTWNADVYGVSSQVQCLCAEVANFPARDALIHIDPDRRSKQGKRSLRVADSSPGLESLRQLAAQNRGGAIKLSPASDFASVLPEAECELISVAGECKEATVWFGELAQAGLWRATVLPTGATLAGNPLEYRVDPGPVGGYLYDPDPAVVRAGLIDQLAVETGFRRLDAAEEYLTADEIIDTPFARGFQILDVLPNNDRALRRSLRNHSFGEVEIKCRHIPIDAERVRRKLPLTGSGRGTVVFARISGKAHILICRRLDAQTVST